MALMSEYQNSMSFGERYTNEDGCWSVWEHETENKVWIQECWRTGLGKAVVQGATLYAAKPWLTGDKYLDAVNYWHLIHDRECRATSKSEVDSGSGGFQVSYEC